MTLRFFGLLALAMVASKAGAAPFKGDMARLMEFPPSYSKITNKEAIDLEMCIGDAMGRYPSAGVSSVFRGRGVIYIHGSVVLTTLRPMPEGGTLVEIRAASEYFSRRAVVDVDDCISS